MAAIKPNKYPTIYEFNYKPRNYESQKIYFKKLQKRENLLKSSSVARGGGGGGSSPPIGL